MPKLPQHKQPKWITKTKKKKRYGFKEEHISNNNKFYHSKDWKDLRAWYIKQFPICKWCEEEGIVTAGEEVDHIKEIEDGGEKLNQDNLMTLCKRHHRQKTNWARAARKKYKRK